MTILTLEQHFKELAARWKQDTVFLSWVEEDHFAYQMILAMGEAAIPLILQDLRDEGGHWFAALRRLTGLNLIAESDRGNYMQMRETWLQWGVAQGYIDERYPS